MAHWISIPVSFEFRTTKVKWVAAGAEVVGWWKREDGVEDPQYVIAEITNSSHADRVKCPLSRLSGAERKLCLATLGDADADEAVKKLHAVVELPRFLHGHKTYIQDSELMKYSQPADAWILRDEFLHLDVMQKTALSFLNKWGRWKPWRNSVDIDELVQLKERVRQALTSGREAWLASNDAILPMARFRLRKTPYFRIRTDSCYQAIRIATTIDLLQQVKFKTCARVDCNAPFPVKSKHHKIYCSEQCAHLVSIRRTREEAARQQS
jgi:hypothetical protein